MATARRSTQDRSDVDALTDALLLASRALVAVAARSIAASAADVTLPQYRALVVLSSRGPQKTSALAGALDVHPSTATRLCDRLVAHGLVARAVPPENRREVLVSLTPRGRRLVGDVTRRRRRELAVIVARIPERARRATVDAMRTFAVAAGEGPEQAWSTGWSVA
jgi:DNA-binding MarR family transcriptional regulator